MKRVSMPATSSSHINALSPDLLARVLYFVDPKTRAAAMCVSKLYHRTLTDPSTWPTAVIHVRSKDQCLGAIRFFCGQKAHLISASVRGHARRVTQFVKACGQFLEHLEVYVEDGEELLFPTQNVPSLRRLVIHAPGMLFQRCTTLSLSSLELTVDDNTLSRRKMWRHLAQARRIDHLILHTRTNLCLTHPLPCVTHLSVFRHDADSNIDIDFSILRNSQWDALKTLTLQGAGTESAAGLWTVRFVGVPNIQDWMECFGDRIHLDISPHATVEIDSMS